MNTPPQAEDDDVSTDEDTSLPAGDSDTVSFVYQIEDTDGATDTSTVTTIINGVNDPALIGGVGDKLKQ